MRCQLFVDVLEVIREGFLGKCDGCCCRKDLYSVREKAGFPT